MATFAHPRDRHGANPFSLPNEVGNHPAALPLLNMADIERYDLFAPQSGAEEQAEQRAIALRLQTFFTRIA
jgi:hypothetical protein